ncbi:MAG: hypothetical protein PHE55_02320, partial [Methylococcaceae bacterium]|nr:hypothetical protein [Methylococcaceae bacterium]
EGADDSRIDVTEKSSRLPSPEAMEAVTSPPPSPPAGARPAAVDPWSDLIGAGVKWMETFAAAGSEEGARAWVETDEKTGKSYLKMPMPEPEAVQKLAEALSGFLAGLRR